MAINEVLDIAMFVALCAAILIGFPVAFTLAGVSLIFAVIGTLAGVFDFGILGAFPQRIYGIMTNQVLIAVPLFIFMGVMLERSRVAEELLEAMSAMFGQKHGGLGISVCIVGALMAASTGIVGATVVTMGLLALPTMLRRGYDPGLASGTIAAAGTLGQIIPPSIVLILLGDVMSTAYQTAQLEQGIFAPDTVSVGDLFAGALIPGLCHVGLYLLYQVLRAVLTPQDMPPVPVDSLPEAAQGNLFGYVMRSLVPPLLLIVAVLGSILGGVATPTEAAAVGAIGATLLAGLRLDRSLPAWPIQLGGACIVGLLVLTATMDLRVLRSTIPTTDWIGIIAAGVLSVGAAFGILAALVRTFRLQVLREVMLATTRLTSMVFLILVGAALFTVVFRGLGGDESVQAALESLPGGVTGALIAVMLVFFVLGFFLDFIEITLVVVPIVAPALLTMGVDPIWLAVMIAVNLQTSFLTPPFGFALFYLRGVASSELRTADLYRGVVPFVLIQILGLLLVALFPALATWLPSVLF